MRTVAQCVGTNVAEIRARRRLSVRALAELVTQLGVKMLASGISKIEKGERTRGVTVDELIALALALEVSPIRLLLPSQPEPRLGLPDGVEPDADVQLTSTVQASWEAAWRWMVGEEPLPGGEPQPVHGGGGLLTLADRRVRDFIRENRPFEDELWMREVVRATNGREPTPWSIRAYNDGSDTSWNLTHGEDRHVDDEDE